MAEPIDGYVVLHIAEDDSYELRVWGAERVRVLWIDERVPRDRVYCQSFREERADDLRELIGSDPVGHAGDGKLDDTTIQAIRAKLWKAEGGRLREAQ